ncbi:hypothetical protein H9Q72_001109 [Fusarium xylarioides]|uniref:Hydrophobin n=1 Tax=Fusarium xylarioides TaxID=221167 RepID=A0A9P7I249_9HYPO|nr:hypothetical protein H9Q70_001254 [Fusarium xylarioides]KAG5772930.1 hypothetical protein H9Q72_001109 [Fusarium xylarioides]KAG5785117.1 hypothetical protein H9Q73_001275 [Fusarium xylarioides]
MHFSKLTIVVTVATVVSAASSEKSTVLSLSNSDGGAGASNACNQKSDVPMCCSNSLVCVPGGWIQGSCPNKLMCCSPGSQKKAKPSSKRQAVPMKGLLGPISNILSDFAFNIDVDAFNCVQVF